MKLIIILLILTGLFLPWSSYSKQQWAPIKLNAACEENSEGIERFTFFEKMEDKSHCMRECESRVDCKAIDWFNQTGWCSLYWQVCKTPTATWDGASSYMEVRPCKLRGEKGIELFGHCNTSISMPTFVDSSINVTTNLFGSQLSWGITLFLATLYVALKDKDVYTGVVAPAVTRIRNASLCVHIKEGVTKYSRHIKGVAIVASVVVWAWYTNRNWATLRVEPTRDVLTFLVVQFIVMDNVFKLIIDALGGYARRCLWTGTPSSHAHLQARLLADHNDLEQGFLEHDQGQTPQRHWCWRSVCCLPKRCFKCVCPPLRKFSGVPVLLIIWSAGTWGYFRRSPMEVVNSDFRSRLLGGGMSLQEIFWHACCAAALLFAMFPCLRVTLASVLSNILAALMGIFLNLVELIARLLASAWEAMFGGAEVAVGETAGAATDAAAGEAVEGAAAPELGAAGTAEAAAAVEGAAVTVGEGAAIAVGGGAAALSGAVAIGEGAAGGCELGAAGADVAAAVEGAAVTVGEGAAVAVGEGAAVASAAAVEGAAIAVGEGAAITVGEGAAVVGGAVAIGEGAALTATVDVGMLAVGEGGELLGEAVGCTALTEAGAAVVGEVTAVNDAVFAAAEAGITAFAATVETVATTAEAGIVAEAGTVASTVAEGVAAVDASVAATLTAMEEKINEITHAQHTCHFM